MNSSETSEARGASHLPRLAPVEWVVFGLLAIFLSFANVYTTLLTGLGFGGSVMAVLSSALMLRILRGRIPSIEHLNLGQTMASAGASMGTAVAAYAAVLLEFPHHIMNIPQAIVLFASLGLLGVLVGGAVRRYMVRYYFPSGTACAVIQKTIASEYSDDAHSDTEEARRPLRILVIWGSIAAVLSALSTITVKRGEAALLGMLNLFDNVQLSLNPLFYGIGVIAGPRVGVGLLLGSLAVPWVLEPGVMIAEGVSADGVTPNRMQEWVYWISISLAALPTLSSIGFAYLFRSPAAVPAGMTPGRDHAAPPQRGRVYLALMSVCLVLAVLCVKAVFALPMWLAVLAIALTLPLCLVNGRISADTDFNPLLLLAIAVLALCAFAIPGDMLALLGLVVIGVTIAGMAIDMMQDHRTGFLLAANPTHQITVQLVGVALAVVCIVPFFALLDATMGIGPNGALLAPGPRMYLIAAKGFSGGFPLEGQLADAIFTVSGVGIGYAGLAAWKPAGRWMPSLFAVAIGLLLPMWMTLAIALGSVIPTALTAAYVISSRGEQRGEQVQKSRRDATLVGASMLGVAAATGAIIALVAAFLELVGLNWFFAV